MKDHRVSTHNGDMPTSSAIGNATRSNFEYLVATLSKRTSGKKYENFVVNYIWNSLADETLKPVTQQYVNRRVDQGGMALVNIHRESVLFENSNHALIDLYFPALHLGIECDEGQHQKQVEQDRARTADIARVIPDYLERRVRVELDEHGKAIEPRAIVEQMDDVVRCIRKRKEDVERRQFEWARMGFEPWRSDQPDWKLALTAGVMRASDSYLFQHNGEVRELFGRGDGAGLRRSHFSTNFDPKIPGHRVWCPTLAKRLPDGSYESTNDKGILNRLLPDGDERLIGEANPDERSVRARIVAREAGERPLPKWYYTLSKAEAAKRRQTPDREAREIEPGEALNWSNAKRITFVRTTDAIGRNGFQFVGVFGPPMGYREVDGISFEVCRQLSEAYELPRGANEV